MCSLQLDIVSHLSFLIFIYFTYRPVVDTDNSIIDSIAAVMKALLLDPFRRQVNAVGAAVARFPNTFFFLRSFLALKR